jgi:hypothetical protein
MKTDWDYKIDIQRIHNLYEENTIDFDKYIKEIVREVVLLKDRVTDITLKNELQCWIADMGDFCNGEFVHILEDDDEEELEYRLNQLYDTGDYNKRIWFGF